MLSSNQDVLLSATEDVRDPDATLSLTFELPAGRGDTLEITATTTGGVSCSGTSQPFDVTAGRSTPVSLVLNCGGVVAGPDSCPVVSVVAPDPAQAVAPSGSISVAATASDADPGDALSFSWTATEDVHGTFDDPTAPSTRYVCATLGDETLVLSVDDHHLPSSCSITVLVPVTCLPRGDAGG